MGRPFLAVGRRPPATAAVAFALPVVVALAAAAGAGCERVLVVAVTAVDAAPEVDGGDPDAGTEADAEPTDAEPARDLAGGADGDPSDAASDLADPPGPDPSLIGHWTFDEAMGTRAEDVSGNGNDATLERTSGASAWAPGQVGHALALNGASYARVSNSTSINSPSVTNAVTIAAWVWTASYDASGFNFIASRQIAATPFDNYGLTLRNGRPTFALFEWFTSPSTTVPLRRWVHLAGTWDGTIARVFVNGALVAQGSREYRISSQSRPFIIGGNQNDGSGRVNETFEGYIDELRLYNRALSRAEVAALIR